MAEPVPIEGGTDFSATGCLDLPCIRGTYACGTPFLLSRWRLTKPEIEELSRTGYLYLTTLGTNPQPTRITTHDPRTM